MSLVGDRQRGPFEIEDAMGNCKEKVGKGKKQCLVTDPEHKLYSKICGTFVTEEEFCPGEERQCVFEW